MAAIVTKGGWVHALSLSDEGLVPKKSHWLDKFATSDEGKVIIQTMPMSRLAEYNHPGPLFDKLFDILS